MPSILQKISDKVKIIVQNKDMVFIPFRRYWSMRQQSAKVQALYDHSKSIFTPSGTPPPSSQALDKLRSMLDTVQPADVGLTEETTDDDRGHGFFGFNQLNRVARWAQPITYIDVHECDSFTPMTWLASRDIFLVDGKYGSKAYNKPNRTKLNPLSRSLKVIPLHDHPGMTVFSKILYGSLHVKSYDWVEPARFLERKEPGYPPVRLAKLAVDRVLTAPCETSVLYPKHGGNIHCFTAVTPCAVLDILSPSYREDAGRKCTYYHDYPHSTFSAGNGPEILDSKEEEYAWLAEIETPSDLYMRQGVYAGPAIQV